MKKYRLKCYRCGNINEFILGDWYHCQKCNEQQDTLCEMFVNDVLELEQQNKRYREVIDKIKKTSDDYRAGHLLDIQDSFFVDEIIAIIKNLEGDLE